MKLHRALGPRVQAPGFLCSEGGPCSLGFQRRMVTWFPPRAQASSPISACAPRPVVVSLSVGGRVYLALALFPGPSPRRTPRGDLELPLRGAFGTRGLCGTAMAVPLRTNSNRK